MKVSEGTLSPLKANPAEMTTALSTAFHELSTAFKKTATAPSLLLV